MKSSPRSATGFTLVELMVSVAIIGLIMLVLVAMTNQISQHLAGATEKIEKFQEARDGFEAMTRRMSQATLNTYWDYLGIDSSDTVNPHPRDVNVAPAPSAFASFVPQFYGRATALRFVCKPWVPTTNLQVDGTARPGDAMFFQAPFGVVSSNFTLPQTGAAGNDSVQFGAMKNLLNTWGYFVEAGYDPTVPQFVTNTGTVRKRWRSRLYEFMQPAEQMSLYDGPTTPTTGSIPYWYLKPGMQSSPRPARALAENVLTLILLPKLSKQDEDARAAADGPSAVMLSPQYIYDSTPPKTPVSYPILNPGANGGADPGMLCPKNQLPPIVMVTMIAVDERSAERLDDKYPQAPDVVAASTAPGANYSQLFKNAANLENPAAPGGSDLYKYEQILQYEKVTYRVFTTNVTIRGAKWSRMETK